MAGNYQKNKLLLEEKKQEKKKLYKNWKFYASALGIIIIGTGTGLGIYYGVNANNIATNDKLSNQQIVDAINANNYNIEVQINSDSSDISVTDTFIKTNLSTKVNNAFNDNLFSYTKITINNVDLKNSDLLTVRSFQAKINYNYDSIKNQTTDLTINVKVFPAQIATAIHEAEYSLDIPVKTTVNDLEKDKITSDFIKQQLTGEITTAFDTNVFHFNKITVNDNNLQNNDLAIAGTINAKINYNYDSIKNQTTNLTINVIGVDDEQIVNEINNKTYLITTTNGTNAEDIISQINSKLIKQQLTGDFDKAFNNSFVVNKVTIDNNELNDNDLKEVKLINAKINYNYGIIFKAETNLKINIVSDITEQDVISNIRNTIYKIKITKGTTASNLTNQINTEFIQDQLFGQIATAFDASKFTLNFLTLNSNRLQDSDLTTVRTINNAKINYTYGSNEISIWEANLIITIE